jgi:hypothetical protein
VKKIYINGSQILYIKKHAFAHLPNLEEVYLYVKPLLLPVAFI